MVAAEAAVRRLAVARAISWAGSQAAYIALIALVYQRSGGSAPWISATLLAALGARVAASPWAGALGDALDRRLVMVGSDVTAALCFVAITQVQSLPLLVAVAAAAGAAEAAFSPASGALMRMLVPEERRGWANGLIATATSTGMLLGATFGGLLVAAFGAPAAFVANAASFLVSALLVWSIGGRHRIERERAREARGTFRGVALLIGVPVLRRAAFGLALVALALGMTNVAEYPLFVQLGAGRVGFGIAVAVWGAGQIVGGRSASRIKGWSRERHALIFGCALASIGVGLSGAIPVFLAVAAMFFGAGIGNAIVNIGVVMTVQRWSPPEFQARALAAVEAIANTAIAISLVAGGLLVRDLGPRGVYLLAGALGLLAVALCMQIPRDPANTLPGTSCASDDDEHGADARMRKALPALA